MSARASIRRGPSLVDAILLCYPRAWRRRYADEVLALALSMESDGASRWRTRLDLVRSAPAAWMHAAGPSPESVSARRRSMAVTCSAWGLLALLVGGSAFAKLQDDTMLMHATAASAVATWGLRVATAGGIAAGIVTVLAAVPATVALARLGSPGARLLARLTVLPAAAVTGLGSLFAAEALIAGHPVHSAFTLVVVAVLALVLVAVGALVTAVTAGVARRVPETPATASARRLGVGGLACCALVTMIGTATWWAGIAGQRRDLLDRHAGLLAGPLWSSLVCTAPFILVALVLSSLAARSAWSGSGPDDEGAPA